MSSYTSLGSAIQNPSAAPLRQPNDDKARQQEESFSAAWRHEMERAQFENWFKPFDAGTSSATDGGGLPTARAQANNAEGVMSPRPHLLGIVTQDSIASSVPPAFARGREGAAHRPRMAEASGEQMAAAVESVGGASATGLDAAANNLAQVHSALGAVRPVDTVPNAAPAHASNALSGSGLGEQVNPRPVPTAVLSSARALSEISNPLDATWTLRNPGAQGDADKVDLSASASGASAVQGPGALMASEATASPVRLHVQWQGQSASIWLGMDGSASQVSAQVQIVVAELLRHFSVTGQRIARIVCNGSVVFDGHSNRFGRSDSQFAAQVDKQLEVQPHMHPKVNSGRSEPLAPNPQEEI